MAIERIKVDRGSTYGGCLDYRGNPIRFIDKDLMHTFFEEGYLVKSEHLIFKTFSGVVYGITRRNYNKR